MLPLSQHNVWSHHSAVTYSGMNSSPWHVLTYCFLVWKQQVLYNKCRGEKKCKCLSADAMLCSEMGHKRFCILDIFRNSKIMSSPRLSSGFWVIFGELRNREPSVLSQNNWVCWLLHGGASGTNEWLVKGMLDLWDNIGTYLQWKEISLKNGLLLLLFSWDVSFGDAGCVLVWWPGNFTSGNYQLCIRRPWEWTHLTRKHIWNLQVALDNCFK